MTVRKPVNQTKRQPGAPAVPCPQTPLQQTWDAAGSIGRTDETLMEGIGNEPRRGQDMLEPDSGSNPWQSSGATLWDDQHERAMDGLPSVLKAGGERELGSNGESEGMPAVLMVGSTEETPRSSWESQRSTLSNTYTSVPPILAPTRAAPVPPQSLHSTNPYFRPHTGNGRSPERGGFGGENIADIWGNGPAVPQLPQENLQKQEPLRHPFAEPWMNFDTSPVEQALPPPEALPKPPDNPWSLDQPPISNSGNNTDHQATVSPLPDVPPPIFYGVLDEPTYHTRHEPQSSSLPDLEYARLNSKASEDPLEVSHDDEKIPLDLSLVSDVGPPLPPRTSQEKQDQPPSQPPRPPKNHGIVTSEVSIGQRQVEESAKPKRAVETYQIRHINWYDASSPTNPRQSPIMVQNANGPCPLLALVNALVLSTPADYATALVETLRVREQVSLGLLLDAVIDELIGRNGDLSDVSDMYAFLLALHTGMNANPMFVPGESAINLMDAPIEENFATKAQESRKPGGFEDTREMKLYSTFAIPLIHGWIPPRNHPAFAALKRTARTYEDAQNLLFREEELEGKLQRQGLNSEEQIILEDIASVKYFLSSTATQLTGYGLDTMTETMAPASIAILFRNNHYSTLYKHPKSGQLLTLVTDMGYAGHDEVVWESLVDVNGEGCEFFSGDFRPVGNNVGETQDPTQSRDEQGWTTVNGRSRRPAASNQQSSHPDLPPLSTLNINDDTKPLSPNTEQEDHDLALAMQLQEEEEERDRQEAAARRREDELSQAYLNSSDASGRRTFPGFSTGATGAQGGPSPPPRGRGSGRGRGTPPSRPTPPRNPVDTEDAPPPTYEQAAKGPAYHPPANHTYPSSSPGNSSQRPPPQPTRPRQSSAYSEHAASYGPQSPSPYGPSRRGHGHRTSGSGAMRGGGADPGLLRRRTGSMVEEEARKDKDKDCVVM